MRKLAQPKVRRPDYKSLGIRRGVSSTQNPRALDGDVQFKYQFREASSRFQTAEPVRSCDFRASATLNSGSN